MDHVQITTRIAAGAEIAIRQSGEHRWLEIAHQLNQINLFASTEQLTRLRDSINEHLDRSGGA